MTDGPKKMVWIYVHTNHYVGHPDHLKVFATPDAADEWFKENDPELNARFRNLKRVSFYANGGAAASNRGGFCMSDLPTAIKYTVTLLIDD